MASCDRLPVLRFWKFSELNKEWNIPQNKIQDLYRRKIEQTSLLLALAQLKGLAHSQIRYLLWLEIRQKFISASAIKPAYKSFLPFYLKRYTSKYKCWQLTNKMKQHHHKVIWGEINPWKQLKMFASVLC